MKLLRAPAVMTLKFTRDADQDLIALYRYGAAEHSVAQAELYTVALWDALSLLVEQPKLARLRTEYYPALRIHHWRNHYIVYMEDGADLFILRLLHHTSDLAQHLTPATE